MQITGGAKESGKVNKIIAEKVKSPFGIQALVLCFSLLRQTTNRRVQRRFKQVYKGAFFKTFFFQRLKSLCCNFSFQHFLPRSLHRRVCENSENEQWSSHCNLASRHQSSNEIKEVRKRNSCTQTATSLARAHSKTGGEIVAAAINGDLTKTSHACVQSSATCLHHAPFCKKTTQVLKHASPKGCPCYNSHSYFKENIAFNAQSTLLESQLEGPGASSEVPQNGRARNAVVNKDAKKCECNAAPVPKAVAYEICFDINNGCKSKAKDASRSFKQSYFVPKATPCACEELPAPKPPATKPKYQNGTLQVRLLYIRYFAV